MGTIDHLAVVRVRAGATLAVVLTGALLAGCSGAGDTDGDDTGVATATTANGASTAVTSSADPSPSVAPTKATTGSTTAPPAGPAPTQVPSGTTATENRQDIGPTGPVGGSQDGLLDAIPGSASDACQTVGESAGDVRAGSVAVGNFSQMRMDFRVQLGRPGPLVNLYVYPRDAAARSARVTVRPASGGGEAREFSTVAAEQADEWTYFPLRVGVPGPGTWRLDVDAGSSRGCYLVSFAG